MHTFLIIGQSQQERLDYIHSECTTLHIAEYDIHQLVPEQDALSIGIRAVRQFQKEISLKPLKSSYTIGIIQSAELLTIEAQNALLKLLEEPPKHVKIFIECSTASTLLPTITSRCQVTTLYTSKELIPTDETTYSQLQTLMQTASIGEKMALLDSYITNTKDAKTWVHNAIMSLHIHQSDFPKHTYIYYMNTLLTASKRLSANVSYKLVLDHIFIAKNTRQSV